MANFKISQLTGATTPLAGTEEIPVVQSGSTKKVSVNNLTAGKEVPASKVTISTGADALSVYIKGRSSDNQSNIFFNNNADTVQYGYINASASEMLVSTIGARPLSLGAAGATAFQVSTTGNLVPVTAAKGINFTANTPAAGMTSQLLNWYEEGTWTATLTDGTNNATQNRSTCRYTRIGRQVTVAGFISVTSLGSVTGDIRIAGLPFTVGSGDESYSAGAVSYAGNLSITAGQSVTVTAWAGNTYLNLQVWDSANGTTAMQATEFTASGAIMFNCTYTV